MGWGRIAIALAAVAMTAVPAMAARSAGWTGVWRNGSNSVHIKAQPCGSGMCGTVVWANDKAKDDAARGGTDRLVGTRLFRDFRPDGDGGWEGEVYVPDIDQELSGTINVVDRTTIEASGCLFGRLGCKTQIWRRVQ